MVLTVRFHSFWLQANVVALIQTYKISRTVRDVRSDLRYLSPLFPMWL